MKRLWRYFGFGCIHMIHVFFCPAISSSFLIPFLKSLVFMCALYPPCRYPPNSLPSQTYSTPFCGNPRSISSRLKCSIFDVGKLRTSTRTWMSYSSSNSKNVWIERLLCPIVHIVCASANFDVFVGFC